MKTKNFYLVAFIIGTILPYWEFINFLIENGLNWSLFFEYLSANRISKFFVFDVLISAIVVIYFITQNKKGIKNYWLPIIATLSIGISAGLPLFLYLKELNKEK